MRDVGCGMRAGYGAATKAYLVSRIPHLVSRIPDPAFSRQLPDAAQLLVLRERFSNRARP